MTRKAQKKLPAKNAGQQKRTRTPKQIAAQFKPGNKANPIGALAHDPFKREVKAMASKELAEITTMIMRMTVEEVESIINSKSLTIAQKTILRAALDASEHGEIDKFNTIVSRSVGKIPDVVHFESPNGTMSPQSTKQLSEEELRAAINRKMDEIEAAKKL